MATTTFDKDIAVPVVPELEDPATNCRLYKARTNDLVKRASLTVGELHALKIEPFLLKDGTCLETYKQVKKYLSQDVSELPEVQLAFQSIKKLLPDACECMQGSMLEDLKTRLTRPAPTLPSGYVNFCKKIVKELFPNGWDRNWETATANFSPSLGSCVNFSRKSGGQLAALATDGQDHWRERIKMPHGSLKGELLLVNSSGKPRPLTRFESDSSYLRPLHGLIYDQISKNPWLLRGDVTAEKLKNAGFSGSSETSLISGDYVSASDNLPIEIAELILDVIWSSSRHIPASILRFAIAAQRPELTFERQDHTIDSFVPSIGQMMGSYLCFPLLCIQNYLAFRWATKDMVTVPPALINGDDILVEENDKFFNRWSRTISDVGFVVEETKTSVSTEWGTINSTLLRRRGGNLVPIQTTRMGLLRRSRHPANLGASFEKFARVGDPSLWFKRGITFLRWHIYLLRWGCVAQDMNFFGRLARSCWKYAFSGALWMREASLRASDIPSLEPEPCPHNIVMAGNEFQSFPREQVTAEVVKDIGGWMATRKWQLGRSFQATKASSLLKVRQSQFLSGYQKWLDLRTTKRAAKNAIWRFFPRESLGRRTTQLFSLSGQSRCGFGRSWWTRPEKCTDVRVPVELCLKHNLVPQHVSVDVVISRRDNSLFGKGFNMLMNSSAREERMRRIVADYDAL
ncbi:RNA-dependent RNA polymerase [Sclerotinia sclerotiorum ourmia-like virus 1]|uniref:RNA-dependent RNA polymerase n=1 Tax=Sclerotinia sclerotiorum ourmia-like virus 1 TaxID=1708389 RepID=A0A0M4KU45_9VIRU|nr:RNA-dependent RNA polymerase [Sclerotinia sclerotiorum ourmia-like virus 1]ALD89138.1 RNA-dependent RNA polymerase [Sclerotinia sclerotiorum ourmia-like virus 1]